MWLWIIFWLAVWFWPSQCSLFPTADETLNDGTVIHALQVTILSWIPCRMSCRQLELSIAYVCFCFGQKTKIFLTNVSSDFNSFNMAYREAICRRLAAIDANGRLHTLHFKSSPLSVVHGAGMKYAKGKCSMIGINRWFQMDAQIGFAGGINLKCTQNNSNQKIKPTLNLLLHFHQNGNSTLLIIIFSNFLFSIEYYFCTIHMTYGFNCITHQFSV